MNKKKNFYTFQDSANAFLAVLLAQIVVLLVYSSIISAISASTGQDSAVVASSEICLYINMILSELIFFLVYLFYNIATQKKGYKQATRLNAKLNWKVVLVVVGLGFVAVFGFNQFVELINYFLTNILGLNPGDGIALEMNSIWRFLIGIVFLALFPAVFEELVFRGIIFNGLREKLSPKKAIIASALLFALMHLSIYKTVYQFVLGIMLAIIIYYTGSILYSMIFHFINNFSIVLVNYICSTTNTTLFSYTNWGAGEIIQAVGIMLISVVILAVGCYYLGKHFKAKEDFDKDYEEAYEDVEFDDGEANFVAGTDVTGLSDYEIKQLGTSTFITARGWMIIGVIIAAVMWLISSFGA